MNNITMTNHMYKLIIYAITCLCLITLTCCFPGLLVGFIAGWLFTKYFNDIKDFLSSDDIIDDDI